MIPNSDLELFKSKLKSTVRPLFFFDDDCDGVSSYLQLRRLVSDGKGVIVKGRPILEEKYVRQVNEYQPDRVFILDKPMVEQGFLDKVSVEKLWLDHHPVQDNKNVSYFNPQIIDKNDNRPTSYWAYKIANLDGKGSLWLAAMGIVSDWDLSLIDEFKKEYPDLVSGKIDKPENVLFNSKLGELIKIVNFNLKGQVQDVLKSIDALSKVKDPYEILEAKTPQGKYLYKKYKYINESFESHKKAVDVQDGEMLIFKYKDSYMSITSDLANELLYENPGKIIIVGRERDNEIMMSIRSSNKNISESVEYAAENVGGYGGGHTHACGACINKDYFDYFLETLKEKLQ